MREPLEPMQHGGRRGGYVEGRGARRLRGGTTSEGMESSRRRERGRGGTGTGWRRRGQAAAGTGHSGRHPMNISSKVPLNLPLTNISADKETHCIGYPTTPLFNVPSCFLG